MANNPNIHETFHEIPSAQYFFISGDPGIALHKRFFVYYTAFLSLSVFVMTLIGLFTNWYWLLFTKGLTWVYVSNWMIGFPATFFVSVGCYYWWIQRKKRLEKERQHKEMVKRKMQFLYGT